MLNMNRVTLIGHAGRDPEIRTLNNGNKAASFALATTERWKGRDGQPAESTEWHRVVAYGAAAEAAEMFLRKGAAALVEGRLATRGYRDRDGNERTVTEIIVAGPRGVVNVLGSGGRQSADGAPADAETSAAKRSPEEAAAEDGT